MAVRLAAPPSRASAFRMVMPVSADCTRWRRLPPSNGKEEEFSMIQITGLSRLNDYALRNIIAKQ